MCELVFCVHISREDRPCLRNLVFSLAVAAASDTSFKGDCPFSSRRISFSNSTIAFSATGFLLGFFTQPISKDILNCLRISSSWSKRKPGAGSYLTIQLGQPIVFKGMSKRTSPFRRLSCFSSSMKHAVVHDETVSLTTEISRFSRFNTSAACEMPTKPGGSSVDCLTRVFGNRFKVAQVWHESDAWSIAFDMSTA